MSLFKMIGMGILEKHLTISIFVFTVPLKLTNHFSWNHEELSDSRKTIFNNGWLQRRILVISNNSNYIKKDCLRKDLLVLEINL